MEITKITRQKNDPDRFSVFVDEEFAFGIDSDGLIGLGIKKGRVLSQDELEELRHQAEYTKARDAAVRYLSKGLKSERELRFKLAEKGYSAHSIDRVAELLLKRGYIDDAEFAKSFVSHKQKINNFGKQRIVRELIAKGIAEEYIAAAFFESDNEAELVSAQKSLAKKLKGRDISALDIPDRRRIIEYMIRRGFSPDMIRELIK